MHTCTQYSLFYLLSFQHEIHFIRYDSVEKFKNFTLHDCFVFVCACVCVYLSNLEYTSTCMKSRQHTDSDSTSIGIMDKYGIRLLTHVSKYLLTLYREQSLLCFSFFAFLFLIFLKDWRDFCGAMYFIEISFEGKYSSGIDLILFESLKNYCDSTRLKVNYFEDWIGWLQVWISSTIIYLIVKSSSSTARDPFQHRDFHFEFRFNFFGMSQEQAYKCNPCKTAGK